MKSIMIASILALSASTTNLMAQSGDKPVSCFVKKTPAFGGEKIEGLCSFERLDVVEVENLDNKHALFVSDDVTRGVRVQFVDEGTQTNCLTLALKAMSEPETFALTIKIEVDAATGVLLFSGAGAKGRSCVLTRIPALVP